MLAVSTSWKPEHQGDADFLPQPSCWPSESASCATDLKSNEIVSTLEKWLNEEIRDQLRSIHEKLADLAASRELFQKTHKSRRRSIAESLIVHDVLDGEKKSVSSNVEALRATSLDAEGQLNLVLPSTLPDKSPRSSTASQWASIQATIEFYEKAQGRFKASVWRFMEDRTSSTRAYACSFVIPTIVLISIFLSFWQTVDGCPVDESFGEILEASFELVFATELLLRFAVCPDKWSFWRNLMNLIDALTCLPLVFRLVAVIVSSLGTQIRVRKVLSAVTLLPVLKLLKLTRRFEKFQLLLSAFLIALEALPVLLYTLLVIALIFSGMIYTAEPRENISSLPNAMWFTIVTMTTCGYGDVTPSTVLGHTITSMLMIVSILYMAMPIGIVGNAFGQVWNDRDRLLLMQRLRDAFLQRGFSEKAFREIVRCFDLDGDGELDLEEFQTMLVSMNIYISAERVYLLLDDLDEDKSGRISVDELLSGLFPHDYYEYFNTLKVSVCNSANRPTCNSANRPQACDSMTVMKWNNLDSQF